MSKNIPFHGNPDGNSCGQCVYKMMLEHFCPDEVWSLARVNALCGAIPGKYTWTYEPIVQLSLLGFDVIGYTNFDTELFVANPTNYLTTVLGDAGSRNAIENSDMSVCMNHARKYLDYLEQNKIREFRQSYNPEILRQLLDDGYLTCVWVNSRKLNRLEGYAGHFILVFGYDQDDFIAHDPGYLDSAGAALNQISNRRVSSLELIEAASPKIVGETSTLIAIRKHGSNSSTLALSD